MTQPPQPGPEVRPAPNGLNEPVVLLTGYAAKQCARRVHNEWDATIESVPWELPPELKMRFDSGRAFEDEIFAKLKQALGERCIDLSDLRGKQACIDATVAAMDQGVEVILGGWLPDDTEGGRTGKPDLLLRQEAPRALASYVPGDVKQHRTTARRAKGTLRFSRVSTPGDVERHPGYAPQTTGRLDDHLQLAHYWRMLEACGRAPDGVDATGFIIGTDQFADLDPLGVVLVWLDLDARVFETYSRSQGTAKRTAMERYDHEQGFRLKVAKVAASRSGSPHDPLPLVEPIFKDECDSCPWYDYCRDITGADVASAQITSGRLSVREWHALQKLGVSTIDDLAGVDVANAEFRARYLPEVTHVKDPLGRLEDAIRRASMIRSGAQLERETTGSIDVPRADIEIDFDIEWDVENRVYLWGALVNRAGEAPTYEPTVDWRQLDDETEIALAESFVTWLRDLVTTAEARGESVLIYHYSHPEPAHLKRLLGDHAVQDLTARFVDLLAIIREHYFGLQGLGIKKVAPAFGFDWRDEQPGGLQSQVWLQQARDRSSEGHVATRQRILDYNEDDVRATAAIRAGLTGA